MALVHKVGWDAAFCARDPWLWPLATAAERLADFVDWPSSAELAQLFAAHTACAGQAPLRFGPNVQKRDKRSGGRVALHALYDARIALAGEVPTRERDWHDLLNVLCFATFPRSKRALHARQYRALAARIGPDARTLPNARTPEQDALTLFDEGGVIVAVLPAALPQLMAASEQERTERCRLLLATGEARIVPFGHALFEHLIEGLRCPGGSTQLLALSELWPSRPELLAACDAALCQALEDPAHFRSPRTSPQLPIDALREAVVDLVGDGTSELR